MSKHKHTPGPWHMHCGLDYVTVLHLESGKEIYSVRYPNDADLANAQLICHTHNMIEVLKKVLTIGAHERAVDYVQELARDTLAKAGVQ